MTRNCFFLRTLIKTPNPSLLKIVLSPEVQKILIYSVEKLQMVQTGAITQLGWVWLRNGKVEYRKIILKDQILAKGLKFFCPYPRYGPLLQVHIGPYLTYDPARHEPVQAAFFFSSEPS